MSKIQFLRDLEIPFKVTDLDNNGLRLMSAIFLTSGLPNTTKSSSSLFVFNRTVKAFAYALISSTL